MCLILLVSFLCLFCSFFNNFVTVDAILLALGVCVTKLMCSIM